LLNLNFTFALKRKDYPYLNKSLKSLLGERWKDIPGFEGYYKASNQGRIKSLDRTIPHPRLGTQFVEGRILSHSISFNKNIKTGKPMIDLRVSLNYEGVQYYFNTRRLIYITFKDSNLNYEADGLYVINVDGDGYNNALSNLRAVSKSEKQQRVFKRGRLDSYLKTADRTKWKTIPGYSRRKPIKQYTLQNKLVAKYISVREAVEKTGFDEKAIISAAKGRSKQWKGFKWQYANNKKASHNAKRSK
jgi:hypothetical protein